MEWYNALRESWGLEALEQDFEEYDDLTEQDFTFGTFDADSDAALVTKQAHAVAEELSKAYSGGLGLAMQTVFLQSSASAAATLKDGYLCRSLTNDFAGCLLYAPCPSSAKDTVILTDFFVAQNYRGLGIARELFQLSFLRLKQRGVHWFIIANTAIPPSLDSLVTRMGFERRGIVLVADITKL
jgi:GNAT superfamily N-acetyltransferase